VAVPSRLTREEIEEMTHGLPPVTNDDVSITAEGIRLDTTEMVVAFFEHFDRD
jgi:hypothetical protein